MNYIFKYETILEEQLNSNQQKNKRETLCPALLDREEEEKKEGKYIKKPYI